MALSEGDTIGSFCHTVSSLLISPPRSIFPTSNFFLRLQERIVGGLFLSSQHYDSLFSHLLGINYRRKPPWILHYINHSPVLFFSPVPVSFRQQSLSIMGDNLRKSVPDLTLGFVDAPIALPPAIASCTASINRFHLVVMTVNSRKQHFRALIGPRIWVWDLADVCVGRSVSPGKFQFQYRKEESMALVLHRVVWSLNDWMLNINRWYSNIIEEARTIIPFWFRLSGVRDHGYGSEIVSIFSAYKTSQNQIWVSGTSNSDVGDDGVMVWPDRIKKSRLIFNSTVMKSYIFVRKRFAISSELQWIRCYRRHDPEPLQATDQSFRLIRVMQKAFRSFIYKMIAFYEYMKRGLNRFYLSPVRLLLESRVTSTSSSKLGFNFLYLFQLLFLSGFMYHVSCKTFMK